MPSSRCTSRPSDADRRPNRPGAARSRSPSRKPSRQLVHAGLPAEFPFRLRVGRASVLGHHRHRDLPATIRPSQRGDPHRRFRPTASARTGSHSDTGAGSRRPRCTRRRRPLDRCDGRRRGVVDVDERPDARPPPTIGSFRAADHATNGSMRPGRRSAVAQRRGLRAAPSAPPARGSGSRPATRAARAGCESSGSCSVCRPRRCGRSGQPVKLCATNAECGRVRGGEQMVGAGHAQPVGRRERAVEAAACRAGRPAPSSGARRPPARRARRPAPTPRQPVHHDRLDRRARRAPGTCREDRTDATTSWPCSMS